MRAGVPIGDITAGLYATIGVLAGLQRRAETGTGQYIDISMLDSQVSLLSYLAQYFFIGGYVAKHQGRAHVSIPTYNTFATKEGSEIVIAANTQEMWKSLCRVLGREDLPGDERFATGPKRLENREALVEILRAEFSSWLLDEIYEELVANEVPAAPINPIDVALGDPQVRHREMVVRVPHRSGKSFLTVASPVKSPSALGEPFGSPPALGGATVRVLHDLGYSDADISRFVAEGCVASGGAGR